MTTKVRLVKCPNCRSHLAELPEIPVYKCGGCNTILQAKLRKPDIQEESHEHETDEHVIKEEDCVSSFIHSTKDATVSPIDESSAPSTSRCDDNIETMDMKESQERDYFQEVPFSPGRNFTEYEDSSMEQNKGISALNLDTEADNNGEWHQGRRLSDDVPISMEFTSNEMEDSSPELQPIMGTEDDTYDTDQYTEALKIRRRKGKGKYFEGSNISDDVSSVMLDSSPESGTHGEMSKSVHLSQHNDSTGSSFAFIRPEVNLEAQREIGKESLDSKESDPVDDSKSPSDENISVNSVISPDNQHLEPPWKSYHQDFKPESGADSSIREPHVMSPDFVKFPTRSYYASYDGMDDLVPTRSSKPPRRKLKPPPAITSEEGLFSSEAEMHYRGYNRSGVNDPMGSESEVQHLGRKATFLEANHITMKYGRYDQDYGVNRMRPQNKDFMQRFPRDSFVGQIKDGPPTNYKGRYSRFVSQDMPLHNEPDKLELLKMINELKDELNRTRISNSSFPARFSGEDNTRSSYHQSAPARGIYGSHMKGLPQGPRFSRMAYSGEASDDSLRGNCNCLHCFPQGHNYTAGLPSHEMYSIEAHHLGHNGHKFNRGSYSESSSRQLGFQFLQEHQTMSDDRRRHRERENVTKRDIASKRYIRPAAGGIPILSCHHCSELLLIPADFLMSGRRCHQLKCNKCKKIMNFSLKSKKHLVPCIPDVAAPPPSVVNDYGDSNGGPVSFSDEYGMSIDRSCSIQSEHLAQHDNLNNRMLTAAAFKPFNDQRAGFNMRESNVNREKPMNIIRSTGKGKMKELPPKPGGILHRLMGYSSPSQVFRR